MNFYCCFKFDEVVQFLNIKAVFNSDLFNIKKKREKKKGENIQASSACCTLSSSESLIISVSFALSSLLELLLNLPTLTASVFQFVLYK